MERTEERGAKFMLIASMLIFGTVGVFRRSIPLSSAFIAFVRGILGGLFLLVYARMRGKGIPRNRPAPRAWLLLILSGAMIGFNWVLLFEAYNHTTVAVATLCYYMQPTIVMLLSPLLFRQRMTGIKAACALISLLGMVLVSGAAGEGARGGDFTGILLGLGAAVLYSGVVITNKKIEGVDVLQRTTTQLLSAGVVMIPYLLLTGGFQGIVFTTDALLLLPVMGLVHTGIAYALYFGSISRLNVQSVAMFSYIDPVSALLFAALLLREPLTLINAVGAVLIIGSAMISEMPRHSAAAS